MSVVLPSVRLLTTLFIHFADGGEPQRCNNDAKGDCGRSVGARMEVGWFNRMVLNDSAYNIE